MKTIDEIIERLNDCGITVDEYTEDKKLCGYELSTYTNGGVNQNIFLDFRSTNLNPKNAEDFLQVWSESIEDIDIDEEVELNRGDKRYREAFSLTASIQDFKDWKENLQGIFTTHDKELEKSKTETRVYLISTYNCRFNTTPYEWDDEKFISEAEIQGRVYSLQGFQEAFNTLDINSNYNIIRILTVSI